MKGKEKRKTKKEMRGELKGRENERKEKIGRWKDI